MKGEPIEASVRRGVLLWWLGGARADAVAHTGRDRSE